MLSIKLTASQNSSDINDIVASFEVFKKKMGNVPVADDYAQWVSDNLNLIKKRLVTLKKSAQQSNLLFSRVVDNRLDEAKKAMMQPLSVVTETFPLLVRSVSHDQGKEVGLIIRGEDIEIDRRILEEIKDPLIHIIRNCIDHGIERAAVREANKKVPRGTITIEISHIDSGKISIKVSDDGSGINIEHVRKTAVLSGIISQEMSDSLNDDEALSLIFHSGLSTSPLITTISGRGVGLAIVREKIEKLHGTVSVRSELNNGTLFSIILPLTIASFRGVLIRVYDQIFLIPSINIERVIRLRREEIKTVENRESIVLNDRPVSFLWLKDAIQLSDAGKDKNYPEVVTILILTGMNIRLAFGIDDLISEEEVLVKNLGKQLLRVRNISGVAILGTGKAVPVINVQDLTASALKHTFSPPAAPGNTEEDETGKKSILVAEDSITSRILLKNILESAGYNVITAVDGIDAITMLKTGDFDLVVSDIEMPRMDGFDLTSKIRMDKKFAEMPVVLVTALETREDREKGIGVGADAYIVKSSFDQSNLLEVIRRLI
ncbi:MAG: response regulator [Nitrospira sp.]|nr:response regulator [Nitrospira sp.]